MPLLINRAARSIGLCDSDGNEYVLLPAGPAVDVPAKVAARGFVQSLLASGDIAEVAEAEVEPEPEAEVEAKDDGKAKAGKGGK